MNTSGAASGRPWWVINAAILLVFSFVLSSCGTNASALSATATATDPDIPIIQVLVVDSENKPIKGAMIHVPGTDQEDDDDYEGYWLRFCIQDEIIVAKAPGYQESSVACNGLTRLYQIVLQPVPNTAQPPANVAQTLEGLTDDPNYSWLSAKGDCAGCHAEYLDWQKSGHAATNQYFETMYKGTSINGQIANPGFRLDYSNEYGNCVYCHVPAAVGPFHQEVDLSNFFPGLGDPIGEGITCDICHKVKGLKLDDNRYPYSDRPGILSFDFGRPPSNQRLMIGPYSITQTFAGESMTCSPVFSRSEFCAACHYGKFYDEVMYSSYEEWRQINKYSMREIPSVGGKKVENKEFRSCQDCHMPTPLSLDGRLPSERDACSASNKDFKNFDHNLMHYDKDPADPSRIPLLVQGAAKLDVELDPNQGPNILRVIVKVTNIKAGHKFPTDSPLRHLILVVEATDSKKNLLPQIDGSTIPNWAGVGNDVQLGMTPYGGKPGKIFAKILVDKATNLSPTAAYWKPTRLLAGEFGDNRLDPGKPPDESEYRFAIPPEGQITVSVKLIYRFAYFDLALQKSWYRPDVVVTTACQMFPNPDVRADCAGNP